MEHIEKRFWYNAERLDDLLDDYKSRIDVVVSTIGLPYNASAMAFWDRREAPAVALLEGKLRRSGAFIEQNLVEALVVEKKHPDVLAQYERKMPSSNLDKAFKRRYYLVTPKNINKLKANHPALFGLQPKATSDTGSISPP